MVPKYEIPGLAIYESIKSNKIRFGKDLDNTSKSFIQGLLTIRIHFMNYKPMKYYVIITYFSTGYGSILKSKKSEKPYGKANQW